MNRSQQAILDLDQEIIVDEPIGDRVDAYLYRGAKLLNILRQQGLSTNNVNLIVDTIGKIALGEISVES